MNFYTLLLCFRPTLSHEPTHHHPGHSGTALEAVPWRRLRSLCSCAARGRGQGVLHWPPVGVSPLPLPGESVPPWRQRWQLPPGSLGRHHQVSTWRPNIWILIPYDLFRAALGVVVPTPAPAPDAVPTPAPAPAPATPSAPVAPSNPLKECDFPWAPGPIISWQNNSNVVWKLARKAFKHAASSRVGVGECEAWHTPISTRSLESSASIKLAAGENVISLSDFVSWESLSGIGGNFGCEPGDDKFLRPAKWKNFCVMAVELLAEFFRVGPMSERVRSTSPPPKAALLKIL